VAVAGYCCKFFILSGLLAMGAIPACHRAQRRAVNISGSPEFSYGRNLFLLPAYNVCPQPRKQHDYHVPGWRQHHLFLAAFAQKSSRFQRAWQRLVADELICWYRKKVARGPIDKRSPHPCLSNRALLRLASTSRA